MRTLFTHILTSMKKVNKLLVDVLYELRNKRKAPCMFMPCDASLEELSLLLYYEFFDIKAGDMHLISLLLQEFISRGLLSSNPVTYYFYELDSCTFHDVYLTTSDNDTFCRGTSIDKSEAYAKAFGELFERTSLRYHDGDPNSLSKNERQLRKKGVSYVPSSSFPQPTELQKEMFPKSVTSDIDIFSWTRVTNMRDSKKYYVPSQAVFFNNYSSYPDEKTIIQSSTHGAGAGYSEKDALSSGVLEVINRHFFLEAWYQGNSQERIGVESIPSTSSAYKIIQDLEKRGFVVHVLNYSKKALIPSVIVIIIRDGGWSCGGSAGINMEKAIERAVCEAFSSYLWHEGMVAKGACEITSGDISTVKSGFADNILGEAFSRVMLYSHAYFLEHGLRYKNFLGGNVAPFTKEYDKNSSFSSALHAVDLFGDVYYMHAKKEYLADYKYYSTKVIIPKSFFFSLSEVHSRPVLEGTYPQNTEINPFP